jgi:hypothetical protein
MRLEPAASTAEGHEPVTAPIVDEAWLGGSQLGMLADCLPGIANEYPHFSNRCPVAVAAERRQALRSAVECQPHTRYPSS